jgi:hypothetical protein
MFCVLKTNFGTWIMHDTSPDGSTLLQPNLFGLGAKGKGFVARQTLPENFL